MKYKVLMIISGLSLIFNVGIAGIYWADLHSHTSLSDGEGMPNEAYLYARDTANIDILAITDHTHYMNAGSYEYLRQIANQFTENNRFVAIAGQEFGNLSAFGHFSIFEAESLCPVSVYNLEYTYTWIANYRVFTQFNHPGLGDFDYLAFSNDGDKYIKMLEVVNAAWADTGYFEQRFIEALNLGWHLAPVANQDNHHRHWGNATTIFGQIPLTGIICNALSKDNVLEAIGQRRIYACEVKPANDRIYLTNFSIGSALMGDIYKISDKNMSIRVSVNAVNKFAKIYLFRNGIICDSMIADSNYVDCTFNDTMTNGYYFIKGIQQDGDRFWSAPIWVIYEQPPQGIEAWPNPIRNTSQIKFADVAGAILSEMSIYTMEGKLVYTQSQNYPFQYTWNGKDNSGKFVENGIYFIVVKVSTENETKVFKSKVALLR